MYPGLVFIESALHDPFLPVMDDRHPAKFAEAVLGYQGKYIVFSGSDGQI